MRSFIIIDNSQKQKKTQSLKKTNDKNIFEVKYGEIKQLAATSYSDRSTV